ncbi:MAG: hypothetical protein ABJ251_08055 [Paracoccaceae bacterium]
MTSAVDFAAVSPSLLDQIGLTHVFLHTWAFDCLTIMVLYHI